MKKIFVLIIFLSILTPVFAENIRLLANENYLYLSEDSITNIETFPAGILGYEIISDIFNTKNQVILSPQKAGHTKLTINKKGKSEKYEIIIGNDENITSNSIIKIDRIIKNNATQEEKLLLDVPVRIEK